MISPEALSDCVLAIDVGGTKISGALVDREFNLVSEKTVSSRETIYGIADSELLITKALIAELIDFSKRRNIEILRGAAGFPEYVTLDGELTTAENINWRVQPKADFAEMTGFPWVIESDVRCAGIAEAHFGAGSGLKDFVYLTISSGISHTHFLKGLAVTGNFGEAIGFGLIELEIGDQIFELEKYCSGLGISRRYAQESQGGTLDAKTLMSIYETDSRAKKIISSAAIVLGREMAKLMQTLMTKRAVVGGGLWLGSERYRELTRVAFEETCKNIGYKASINEARVEKSGVIGAAIYAIDNLT